MKRIGWVLATIAAAMWTAGNAAVGMSAGTIFGALKPDKVMPGRIFEDILTMWLNISHILFLVAVIGLVIGWTRGRDIGASVLRVALTFLMAGTALLHLMGFMLVLQMSPLRERIYENKTASNEEVLEFDRKHQWSTALFKGQTIVVLLAMIAGIATTSSSVRTLPRKDAGQTEGPSA